MKVIYKIFFVFLFVSLLTHYVEANEAKGKVLISIAPYRYFVDRIAGDTVDVDVVVPEGATSHSYEPTPKQMLKASAADVWFVMGEGFEPRLKKVLLNYHPKMKVIDLREGVNLIQSECKHDGSHCQNMNDPHIWLSPKEAKTQAKTIQNALSQLYPENDALYRKNLSKFNRDLDEVDRVIREKLTTDKPLAIIVSHPAYGYLARDYGFQQISIEFEGREPTPKQLTDLIDTLRKGQFKTVFVQPQHLGKGAHLVADHLNLKVVSLDPFSEDYINNLLKIADAFSKSKPDQKSGDQ